MDYKAIFLDEDLNEIGIKSFKPTDEFITFKKGTFNIRLNAYLYRNKHRTLYCYIYPTDEKVLIDIKLEPISEKGELKNVTIPKGRLLTLKEKWEKGDLKLVVTESIIGQLARLAVMGLKTNWVLLLIVGVSVGLGVGFSMYSFGYNSGVTAGINQYQQFLNATFGVTNSNPMVKP